VALLVDATDAHFAWMLGEAPAPDALRLPPGGLDDPFILRWLRRGLAEMGPGSSWLMVAGGEVVGLCSLKSPPEDDGFTEVGYGVAVAHRRRGYATRAAAEMALRAALFPGVRGLWASTAADNEPSQKVLSANGFIECGRATHPEEGDLVLWRRAL
jgi:RimJ/RimL family protein N-acetyltransferase